MKRECPNCGRETKDEHETICIRCGHVTVPYKPKRKTFKSDVVTKGKIDVEDKLGKGV